MDSACRSANFKIEKNETMNTNLLKKFAQETRIKLLGAVETKLNYVLNGDSADLRDYTESIQILKKDIKKMGKATLIDKVAYTWFNRLIDRKSVVREVH